MMKMNCDDSYVFAPFYLANLDVVRHNEHRSYNCFLIPSSKGIFFSSLNLPAPIRGAAPSLVLNHANTRAKAVLPSSQMLRSHRGQVQPHCPGAAVR
jgi:hypothetical protein